MSSLVRIVLCSFSTITVFLYNIVAPKYRTLDPFPPDMSTDGFYMASPPESENFTTLTITSSVIAAASLTALPRVCTIPTSSSPTVDKKLETSISNALSVA